MRFLEAIESLDSIRSQAASLRDRLLSHAVCLGETAAATGQESERAHLLAQIWSDAGLEHVEVDDFANVIALWPGEGGGSPIVISVPLDTLEIPESEREIQVYPDCLVGPFVGDNCVALAVVGYVPWLMTALGVQLRANLVLVASSRSLGAGNQAGLRAVFQRIPWRPSAVYCIETVQLGRLNYRAVGLVRGSIRCQIPPDYDWARYGASGTIEAVAEVITGLVQIPVPQRPLTSIVLSSIHGGVAFGTVASETELEVEIRSESAAELERIRAAVAGIVESVAASSGKRLEWSIAARQHPGALDAGHPLVAQARRVLEALGQPIMVYPTTAQLAVVFEHQLPGVTLGLTRAERRVDMGEVREKLEIAPLWDGMTQLVLNMIGADEMAVA